MDVKFKLLDKDNAKLPTRGTEDSAGLDIYSPVDFTVPPTSVFYGVGRYQVPTGLAVALPKSHQGTTKPRSGHGFNRGIDVFEGTIDADYRGEIKILMYNFTATPVEFKKGDKIAQLVITKVEMLNPVDADDLDTTKRGKGGFGHTGE